MLAGRSPLRPLFFALVVVCCALLAGCGGVVRSNFTPPSGTSGNPGGNNGGNGGGNGQTLGEVVYVSGTTADSSNNLNAFIDARKIDVNTGALTPLAGSPFPLKHSQGGPIALAPNAAFAYVTVQDFSSGCCVGPSSLLTLALDPTTGTPSVKQTLPIPSVFVSQVLVHPSGKFVYVAPFAAPSGDFGDLGIFTVQPDGTLVYAGTATAQAAGGVAIDPQGRFLFTNQDGKPLFDDQNNVCGPFESDIWTFSIDPNTGGLTQVGSPATFQRQLCEVGHAPNWLTFEVDPAGQRLFALDAFNGTVTTFAIDASGTLTQLPGVTQDNPGLSFTSAAIDPLGRFLYAGSIVDFFTGFSIANSGAGVLPQLPGTPVQVTPLPNFDEGSRYLAVDPSGTFLFSNENGFTSAFSCCGNDRLVGFRIDPNTGALTQLPGTPTNMIISASGIVVSPPR